MATRMMRDAKGDAGDWRVGGFWQCVGCQEESGRSGERGYRECRKWLVLRVLVLVQVLLPVGGFGGRWKPAGRGVGR